MSLWIIMAIILGALGLMAFSAWGIILWWLDDLDFTTSDIWMAIVGGIFFPAGWYFWINYFYRRREKHESRVLWMKRGGQ